MCRLLSLALLVCFTACGDDDRAGGIDGPGGQDGNGTTSDAAGADAGHADANDGANPPLGCADVDTCPGGYEVCCELAMGGVCMARFEDCSGIPLCDEGNDCPSGGCCPQGFCAEFGCD